MTAGDRMTLQYSLSRPDFDLDVAVDVPLRGIIGVFGESGAGKTTLLRCIAGLEQRATGRLVVAGETWQDGAKSLAAHERAVGYVFQEPRLFAHLDVRHNIEFGRRRRRPVNPDVDGIVELLGIGPLLDRRPAELSGGEAQRAAIARALVSGPRVVLMDEPLASLDRARRDEILPFLDRLHAESRVPVVYVSHGIDEVCRLCDQLLVMDRGRVVASGELQDVLVRTDLPVLAGDEAGTVIEADVDAWSREDGLLRLVTPAGRLWVPGAEQSPGTRVRLRIRANDVSIARSRPEASTILNILPVTVEVIEPDRGATALLRLAAGGATLLARVTRRSVRELSLVQGDAVFAQIKSAAVRSPAVR